MRTYQIVRLTCDIPHPALAWCRWQRTRRHQASRWPGKPPCPGKPPLPRAATLLRAATLARPTSLPRAAIIHPRNAPTWQFGPLPRKSGFFPAGPGPLAPRLYPVPDPCARRFTARRLRGRGALFGSPGDRIDPGV